MFTVSYDFSIVYRQLVKYSINIALIRINVRETTFLLPEKMHAILKIAQKQTILEAYGYIIQ